MWINYFRCKNLKMNSIRLEEFTRISTDKYKNYRKLFEKNALKVREI